MIERTKQNKEILIILGLLALSAVILAFNTDELQTLMKGMYIIATQWGK